IGMGGEYLVEHVQTRLDLDVVVGNPQIGGHGSWLLVLAMNARESAGSVIRDWCAVATTCWNPSPSAERGRRTRRRTSKSPLARKATRRTAWSAVRSGPVWPRLRSGRRSPR